ncbi:hypothetical protein L2E82_16671 [Cichorium intybus]|uniref:Uncharacterized protein n=1 Tax=Cichorium intybus TaxID=13427 RepID=A0ACB9F676_CICIN|nr:hypothetical protein L2E82_16671 [Cichorium intybus]
MQSTMTVKLDLLKTMAVNGSGEAEEEMYVYIGFDAFSWLLKVTGAGGQRQKLDMGWQWENTDGRGYGGVDEAKMLQRHFDGTSVKIAVGANRAAIAALFLHRYGFVKPLDIVCFKKQIPERRIVTDKIGVAILDDGMQDIKMIKARLEDLKNKFDSKLVIVVTEKDYDRDSKILGGLEPFEVLVLCCKLKILGHNGYIEDVFKKLIIQSFGQMTCA